MEPAEKKESGSSGITGTVAAVGIACGFIGALFGAVGWDMWKKEEMQQQHRSRSGSCKPFNTGNCPICQSEMEDLRVLPCGHQYHNGCIKRMKESGVALRCPVCRRCFDK